MKSKKLLLTKLIKYGLAASIGLAIDFGLVIVSKEIFGLHYLVAVCIGFIAGLLVTFILSNKYVFGSAKTNTHTLFIFFGITGIVGLLLLNASVWFLTETLSINYLVSKAIATIGVFMWNFFVRQSLYRPDEPEE